jgi:predicted Zn-dependent protease
MIQPPARTFGSGSCAETRKEAVLPTGTDTVRRRPLARFLTLAGLAVALASCQMFTPPDVQESGFQPSDKPITVDNVAANSKLAELAKAQHPRILATYGGEYSDAKLERMVAKVVGNLTVVSANPTQTYRITILNSPNVNAFALPGG